MNAQTTPVRSAPQRARLRKFGKPKQGFNAYQFNISIPKVANKEIPMHNFGTTFDRFSLPKDRRNISRLWRMQREMQSKSQQQPRRNSTYNRPVHLLKEYLERKDRKYYLHPSVSMAESSQYEEQDVEYSDLIKTAHEFRIKRISKRPAPIDPEILSEQELCGSIHPVGQAKLQTNDKDLSTFNSKNLYEMTVDELKESINWKKQFLRILDQKQKNLRSRSNEYDDLH